jgi:hypothetical protein
MAGRVRAEGLHAPRGMAWQISCADSPTNSLAATNLVANTMPWTAFSVDFTVAPEACRGQWLKLDIPSRTASERQIEGQIWYEDIKIDRIAQ